MEAARPMTLTRGRTGIGERFGLPYFDGILLAAAIGLIAFSDFTLAMATSDDVPGEPLYFVIRQSLYAIIGMILMLAVAKIDCPRFREIPVGLYSLMIAAISLVLVFGAAAAAPAAGSSSRTSASSLRARQAAADRRPRGVRDRAHPPRHADPADPPHPRAGPRSGGTDLPSTGPRHGNRARGHHPRGSLPRRTSVVAFRGDRGGGGARRHLHPGHRAGHRSAESPAQLPGGPADGVPRTPATIPATRAIRSTRA